MKKLIPLFTLFLPALTLAAEPAEVVDRAQLSPGDPALFYRAFAKARAGEPLTLGVIGGSITAGAAASTIGGRYADLVAAHLREMFPRSKVTLVNAGVGATGSAFACLRTQRDLLAHHPDVVIVEFAVNDPNTKEAAETLEGLTRQILSADNHPALLYLFTMHQDGSNAQEWHAKVGGHYHLPMISYRDAMWPEIEAKRLTWQNVSPDVVHPNDRGHAACAQFVDHFLDATLRSQPATAPEPIPMPEPLLTDLFERTWIAEAPSLTPTHNDGWTLLANEGCWRATRPGSTIEFDVPDGTQLSAMYYRIRAGTGQCSVQVDNLPPTTLDAWFPATWGGYRETTAVARDIPPGPHRLRLTLLDSKSPESTGHEFRLLGLGAAGTSPRPRAR